MMVCLLTASAPVENTARDPRMPWVRPTMNFSVACRMTCPASSSPRVLVASQMAMLSFGKPHCMASRLPIWSGTRTASV